MLWTLEEISLSGRRAPRLDRVSVQIPQGVTAVLGQSGAGKTSLLNVLVQFERPSSGRVIFQDATNGDGLSDCELLSHGREGVDGMRQHSPLPDGRGSKAPEPLGVFWSPPTQGLWSHLTVREHLESVCGIAGKSTVDRLLIAFDLHNLSAVRPGSLSLGERSRLSVARALASGARVLVMDEPLAHVDPGRVGSYWTVIRDHCAATGTSLIFATHVPEVVIREANHVLCLTNGRVSYAGPVNELYDHPSSPELAAMLGPCNWLPADEAECWFDDPGLPERIAAPAEPAAICIRPERLLIETASHGTSTVEAARFAGSSAEVDLVDERHGRRRTFIHRPAGSRLRPGDRVLLQVILLFLAMLVVGCSGGAEPILYVKHEAYWSMPPDGPRVPAPRGMTVSPDGEYLVLDNAGRLLVFDETGTLKRQWWMPEVSVGKPEGVCVLKDGRIAVADTHYHRVVLFNHEGEVVGMFGKQGTGPGEFEFPVSVIQDDKENLYICEYGNFNDRAQKFRPDGTFVIQIGSYGTDDGQFQRPSGAAWFEGRIYIVDAFNNRVQVFDENGKLVEILGKSDKISELYYPYDISVTDRGELFVVEYGAGRVSKFDRSGKLLGRYGHSGPGNAQFLTPWGMAIDHRGRVYVCDTGNRRIVELEL